MGQTPSSPRHRRTSHAYPVPTPSTSAPASSNLGTDHNNNNNNNNGGRDRHAASQARQASTSPPAALLATPTGVSSETQTRIAWPTTAEGDAAAVDESPKARSGIRALGRNLQSMTSIRSNETTNSKLKSTVRRRLSRMIPARFHSTPSAPGPSIAEAIKPLGPPPPRSASPIAESPLQNSSPIAENSTTPSTSTSLPTLTESSASDSPAVMNDSSNSNTSTPAAIISNLASPSASPSTTNASVADKVLSESTPLTSQDAPEASSSSSSRTSLQHDPLAEERRAGVRTIQEVMNPTASPTSTVLPSTSTTTDTPSLNPSSSIPPPFGGDAEPRPSSQLVDRLINSLQTNDDPHTIAATRAVLPRTPSPVRPAAPARNLRNSGTFPPGSSRPTSLPGIPAPGQGPSASTPTNQLNGNGTRRTGITQGTSMIVQGIVQTSDLTRRTQRTQRHSSTSAASEAPSSSVPAPSAGGPSTPVPPVAPTPIAPGASNASGSAFRRMLGLGRSPSTSAQDQSARARGTSTSTVESDVGEEPQTPTYLPSARNRGPQESARSSTSAASDDHHHQDGVVRAEHDVESLESREGVDVLSMLLSVVTAATGTSLVNGASAPDLQIVSDLVSQATTNPNEDAAVGDAAAATENTSEPSDPPPATTNDSTEAAQPPSAQNEESTSPEAPSPSSRTRIPNFIRNRMLGQDRTRTISLPSSEAESSATTGGASSLQSPSSPPPRLARAPASAPSSRSQLPRRPRTASNDAHTPLVVPLSRARTESADPHHQHDHRTTTARTRASSPARRSRAELDNDAILHLRSQLTQQLTRALQNNTLGAALEAAGPQIPRPPRPQQRVMSQGAATAANTPTLESLGDLTIPPFDPERVAARRARDAARQSVDEEIPPSQRPAFVGGREQSQERQQQTESPSLTPTADSEPYVVRQESTTEEDVRQHVREEIVAAREMERAEAERNGGRDDAGRSQTPRSQSSSAVPPSPPPVQPESPISAPSSPRPTSALPSIFSSPLFRPASVSPQAIVGQSGSQPMTFGRFLVDIQRDLRVTLGRRNEIERARRERQQELDAERATMESSAPGTVAAASSNASQSQLPASSVNAPRADSEMTPAERDAADAARIRGRHLEPHVPSVDQPLNWWRMFRFPPRDAGDSAPSNAADNGTPSEPRQLVPLLIVGVHQHRSRTTPAVETERAARRTQDLDPAGRGRLPDAQTALDVIDEQEHDDSSSSDGDSTAGEDSDSEAGPGSNADSDSDAESEEMPPLESVPVNRRNRNSTLGSILGRGRADARRPSPAPPPEEELTTQSSASASTQPSERRSLLGRLFPPPSPSRSSSNSRPSTPRDSRTSPPTSRQPSTPSPPPHNRTPAAARARGARHQRESQVLEEESYVIWVVGGYYPEEMVETMVPHILLGHFDQSDLWALTEMMGQVKPPVATRDAIENSGLEVIKMAKLAEYSQAGRIAENTVEKCLICLSEYEEDEDLRVLKCRHAFHKDCVDTWMEKGRNNCPACRSTGVDAPRPEEASSPSPSTPAAA